MKNKVIYISGKITGLEPRAYERNFLKAERAMVNDGWCVVNPVKVFHDDHDKTWGSYMVRNLTMLNACDCVYMLSNWTDSPGAKVEHAFAVGAKKKIIYENK